jgi:tetratricopeptide (TPR) repeat protein
MRQERKNPRKAPPAPARGGRDPRDGRARLALALAVVAGLAASLGSPSNWRWGMNLLHYYPAWLALLWTAAALAAIGVSPGPAGPKPGWLDRLRWAQPALLAFSAALLGALLFNIFRTKSYLLGDGMEIVRRLHQGQPPAPRSALYNLLEPAVFNALKGVGSRAEELAAGVLSILAGTVAVGIAVFYLQRIARRDAAAGLTVASLLLLNGALQLFFGYVEVYPLLAAATLVFYAAALDRLSGGPVDGAVTATLALAVGLVAHPFGMTLIPGWLYLVGGRLEAGGFRPDRKRIIRWIAAGGGLAAVLALVFTLKPEWRAPGGAFRYLAPQEYLDAIVYMAGKIGATRPWADRYRIWSLVHLADFWNTIWLVGAVPLALVLAGLTQPAGRRALRLPAGIFALLSLAGLLAFRALWRTPLGALRDWDLFAGLGYGMAGVAAALVLSGVWRRMAGPVAAASLFFLVPWIGIQIDMERAVQRHIDGVESEPRPEPAVQAPFHCAIGDRCAHLRQLELAALAYKKALTVYPRYEYAWRLGVVCQTARQYADAARALEEALRLRPDDLPASMQLGEVLIAKGDYDRAAAVLDRALQLHPRSGGALLRRAWTEAAKGRLKEARRWLARADSLAAPDDPARKDLRDWQARLAVNAPGLSPSPGGSGPGGTPPAPPAAPAGPVRGSN